MQTMALRSGPAHDKDPENEWTRLGAMVLSDIVDAWGRASKNHGLLSGLGSAHEAPEGRAPPGAQGGRLLARANGCSMAWFEQDMLVLLAEIVHRNQGDARGRLPRKWRQPRARASHLWMSLAKATCWTSSWSREGEAGG